MYYLNINSHKVQCIPYNIPEISLQAAKFILSIFPNNIVNYHWHKDMEYIAVLEGSMVCIIDGQKHIISSGQGIIINSNRIHQFQKNKNTDCIFLSMLIPPDFAEEYEQLITSLFLEVLLLDEQIPWQAHILNMFHQLFDLAMAKPKSFQLNFKSIFYRMWAEINDHHPAPEEQKPDPHVQVLRKMILFIHENYQYPISLEAIAASGNVSKSVCCRIFNKHLSQTPFNYLMNYRIQCSIPLLLEKQMSITQIAAQTGFSNSSYYSEVFKRFIQKSPSEFVKYYLY